MSYPSLPLHQQRAIQRDAINRIKRRKHAAYVAWHFEDQRRGFSGRKQVHRSGQHVKPVSFVRELAGGIAFLVIAYTAICCLGALQTV